MEKVREKKKQKNKKRKRKKNLQKGKENTCNISTDDYNSVLVHLLQYQQKKKINKIITVSIRIFL